MKVMLYNGNVFFALFLPVDERRVGSIVEVFEAKGDVNCNLDAAVPW